MLSSLNQILDLGQDIQTDDLNQSANRMAAVALQHRLCDLGILDPIMGGDVSTPFGPVGKGDGSIGTNTRNALLEFSRCIGEQHVDRLLPVQYLARLIAANPDVLLPIRWDPAPEDKLQTRIAKCVLRYMRRKNYWIARSPRMYNIVYVEGMDANGRLNEDVLNGWNDRRMVIRIAENGIPEMLVNDQATTEPGRYYTFNPLNPNGAARIAFGQYKAWVDGLHHGKQPALVQREALRVHRDLNKDGRRSKTDPIDIGKTFGINQHSTSEDQTPEFVNSYSAGCLVGRRYDWHMSFLDIVRQDVRYIANKSYLFVSTVIAGDDLLKEEGI